ncbi:DNA gyrase subunit A [Thermaurantimonas aggregans]|uniref:DNA gyrase subunit A n=1 Tax=Thermaurantimonas aggregans TaxID=2173829 RepID=A0A401XMM1_9FLAO|nr:DNA gyrase subunit A [Thermaurantimonas aggregans]GCD78251.1 DNA gyrase subunit A [Thermaurantimonas aggregans]
MVENERIIQVNIEEEMKSSYIDYSMSVIVSRALPDVRDGLKPVHRRVLYGMYELGVLSNRPYKKSARIVGEVLGKYHPHGDSSVYDTMVRMAQDWSMRYTLVDGQGNFGSIDGDSPAAMRYTEARLRKIAEEMLSDIEKDTVDFQLNFDDSLQEPTVLPTRIPNLLINGASGIAVGMATNMPPHNLKDAIDAIVACIDQPDISIDEIIKYIKAPDFPTGGIIYGYDGVKEAYHTGRGKIVLRGKANMEEIDGRTCIIVTEIPYQVNKAEMIKKTADLVNEKKIDGISDIRDESDRDGLRVVFVLKRDAIPNVVLNHLYKYTPLQSTFSVNNIALVNGRPMLVNIKELIQHFIDFRHSVIMRRARYELDQAEKKAHILEGLLKVISTKDDLDRAIDLIRNSKNVDEAKASLMTAFELSEIQAKAILELRLQRLTGLEREKIKEDYDALMKTIAYLKEVLENRELQMKIIKDELLEIKEKYGDDRKTTIDYSGGDLSIEDMIADEEVVITISHAGYIKRTSLSEYRTQSRGGVGQKGVATRDEDFVEHIFMATNHNYLLLFTEAGRCFWLKVYEIPEGGKTSKGRAIQNLINLPPDDKVLAYINVDNLSDQEYLDKHYITLVTKKGVIKKTTLEAYSRPRANGINAITIREGDQLLEASLSDGNSEIIIAVKSGKAIRFHENTVRPMGRNAAGVKAVTLADESDEVVGMVCVSDPNRDILVVSENGYGKRTSIDEYRITNRGAKGVKTINITEKTGKLVAIKDVTNDDDLIIINKKGVAIRFSVADLRVMGRNTQGVKLINLKNGDMIASVCRVPRSEEEPSEPNDETSTSESTSESAE